MIAERPIPVEPPAPGPTPEVLAPKRSRALGILFGLFLFVYACAHASPGMRSTSPNQWQFGIWANTGLWFLSAGALVLAGYGLWGFPGLARRWRGLAVLGSLASLILLATGMQWGLWPLILIDIAVLSIAIDSDSLVLPRRQKGFVKRSLFLLVQLLAVCVWLYGAAAILLRPWHRSWGATQEEIAVRRDGDPVVRDNLINHAVTVNAPPEKVWPWLVQLGQGKAGFYSYDALERLLGDDVRNATAIHPEWQRLQPGDLVRAVQPSYLGGVFGENVGWKVLKVEPNRLILLENWGSFWIDPTPDGRSRLGVRTIVGDVPFWSAPIEALVFEPVHFIMEQRMLRTIKELAEG